VGDFEYTNISYKKIIHQKVKNKYNSF
jgi:hypothetical protein